MHGQELERARKELRLLKEPPTPEKKVRVATVVDKAKLLEERIKEDQHAKELISTSI